MTQISGKIYQMKNAAGTENRFPRTVMEAVLGLNTYLQQQFNALADIYMPIEGISEALTDQEFVFRESPASIKAKSLTLDRIKGRTLAWNQMVNRDTSAGFNVKGITGSFSNGKWDYTGSPTAAAIALLPKGSYGKVIANHKYYVNIEGNHSGGRLIWIAYYSGGASQAFDATKGIFVPTQNSNDVEPVVIGLTTGVAFTASLYYTLIDLTLLYGSEIDGLTDAEILAKYEADFGTGYHEYNAGTLISNDASALETVGFNQWDEEWEPHRYNPSTGGEDNVNVGVRSKNYIPVIPNATYYGYVGTGGSIWFLEYDGNKNYLGIYSDIGGKTKTVSANTRFIRFYYPQSIETYAHNICINLSDASKNGTYEPYKKSTLPLNLDDFWVKDGQGNQVHITGGLKSAGSVYDEIVGNKFIQRVARRAYQSGDENDQTVVTDGTYTDYGLATPIEYELAEPLVPTVKAGTTEARISPNADGLSAPFRADITYSASENNDAATSQYAATAGRLLNAQTIWGQSFDGSSPVSGALTGVTTIDASGAITAGSFIKSGGTASQFLKANGSVDNKAYYHPGNSNLNTVDWAVRNLTLAGTITGATSIDSLLYFDTTNGRVGIGTSTPAYKLDVTGTFRATGNSLIGGTLGVTGAATLSGTLAVTGNTTLGGNLTVGTSASNKILSVYGDSNLMGKVYVGKDVPSAPCFVLDADSQEGLKIRPDNAATTHYMHLTTGGVLTVTDGIVCNAYITAGAAAASSDARLKDNISAISTDKALSILSSLKGAEWDWNEKSGLYGQHGSGLVAQEVQKVMPWAVLEFNDKLSLNYNSLWGIVIPVIQSLKKRIEELESRLA